MASAELEFHVTVPTDRVAEVREAGENFIDQLAEQGIPVLASPIQERCVDTPEELEEGAITSEPVQP